MSIRSIPAILTETLYFTFLTSGIINIILLSSGRKIKLFETVITEEFDDPTSELSIGISGEADKFVKISENNLNAIGEYSVEPNYEVVPITLMIKATIDPKTSTQGKGYITVHYI